MSINGCGKPLFANVRQNISKPRNSATFVIEIREEMIMRKIIVSESYSLDGLMSDPEDKMEWVGTFYLMV